jgi:hypothetical protein
VAGCRRVCRNVWDWKMSGYLSIPCVTTSVYPYTSLGPVRWTPFTPIINLSTDAIVFVIRYIIRFFMFKSLTLLQLLEVRGPGLETMRITRNQPTGHYGVRCSMFSYIHLLSMQTTPAIKCHLYCSYETHQSCRCLHQEIVQRLLDFFTLSNRKTKKPKS